MFRNYSSFYGYLVFAWEMQLTRGNLIVLISLVRNTFCGNLN